MHTATQLAVGDEGDDGNPARAKDFNLSPHRIDARVCQVLKELARQCCLVMERYSASMTLALRPRLGSMPQPEKRTHQEH